MADARMKIIIEALNLAAKELKALQGDLKGVGVESKKADQGMDGLTKKIVGMLSVAAAVKIGKMAYELGVLGAQAERTEQGFETISGGSEEAANNLEAMMVATDGAIDRTTAMQMANQMMMMGIADSSDALAMNAEMATRLGRAMGVEAIPAMQNWNAMMANQSLPRLDTYGISSGKVRARILELMDATEGLTREQAFNTAVMEQGQIALDRLGDSVDDNALSIEQATAAYADLKAEIGIGLASAVGGANSVLGKFTTQWGENLRAVRNSNGEIGLLQANIAMFNQLLGSSNTVLNTNTDRLERQAAARNYLSEQYAVQGISADELENQIGNLTKAEELGSVMAEGFAERLEHYKDSAADAASGTYDFSGSVLELQQVAAEYENAELVRQIRAAEEASADAASASLNFAASLGEMSVAAFQTAVLEDLTQRMKDAGAETWEIVEAERALLIEFGLLTPAEEEASKTLQSLNQSMADGKIGTDAHALAVRLLRDAINSLESKTVTVKTVMVTERRGVGQTAEHAFQAAGGVSGGGLTMVGEQGPELVRLPGGAHVFNNPVTHNVTNNFNNTINTRATAGTYMQDIAMARAMMSR